jgi:hypothetical protein
LPYSPSHRSAALSILFIPRYAILSMPASLSRVSMATILFAIAPGILT